MASANKLKAARAMRQLQIDHLNEISSLAQMAVTDESLHTRFRLRCECLSGIYDEFHKQHDTIILLLAASENPDLEAEKAIRTEFFDSYFTVKTAYTNIFSAIASTSAGRSSGVTPNVKLPKISLPSFGGNYKEWPSFYDLFNSLIHNNSDLSKIEKFHYLLSSLTNEPLTLVKNIPLTSDNYVIAYTTLTERYQNKRLLANSCWQSLYNAPKLNNESASGLRKLLEVFTDNLASLKNLGLPVDSWDFVLFHLLIQKLEVSIITRFEMQEASTDLPSYTKLKTFLQKQCTALESVSFSIPKSTKFVSSPNSQNKFLSQQGRTESSPRPRSSFVANTPSVGGQTLTCTFCKASHKIYNCPSFLAKTPQERFNLIKANRWCTNCLHSAHRVSSCDSSFTCRQCKGKHHTLLHYPQNVSTSDNKFSIRNNNNSQTPDNTQSSPSQISNLVKNSHVSHNTSANSDISVHNSENSPSGSLQSSNATVNTAGRSQVLALSKGLPSQSSVLLSTAIVEVRDCQGNFQKVRALLDSASEISVLSQTCLQRLGLKSVPLSLSIFGLGYNSSSSSSGVTCIIRPQGQPTPIFEVETVVLPKICGLLPSAYIPSEDWTLLSSLRLADPNFNRPGPIDILLGADIFSMLLKGDCIRGTHGAPTALDTIFGWVLIGKVQSQPVSSHIASSLCASLRSPLDETLRRFWEVEEVPKVKSVSPEDLECETIFSNTYFRKPSGRYSVALPFKIPEPSFSDTRAIALRRFLSLERRLYRDATLHQAYCDFLQDYLDQGHMELVSEPNSSTCKLYYVPHHSVFNPSSLTTKLRVVFDASSKASNDISLNDCLFVGPKLQTDILAVLLNFRLHSVVFTADVKQMYRQIEVHPQYRDYQRILWRFSSSDPVHDFRLKTVTYGVSSAPYLAIRTLLQLAKDEGDKFPLAANVVCSDIYVDDVVTGCPDLDSALECKSQLNSLLCRGGFELRKWTSNSPEFLETIPVELRAQHSLNLDHDENTIKVLGLQWSSTQDAFLFFTDSVFTLNQSCTKRSMLSVLARVFDPLGFLAPLTFFQKFLIQHLWLLGCDWDEEPPSEVLTWWNSLQAQFSSLSQLRIPRFLNFLNSVSCQLHGFADSSEKGYAAVIYLRVEFPYDKFNVFLISAKSKVAPLKRLCLPRLELCAAVLLADLMSVVIKIYQDKLPPIKIYAWTDSTVTLSWIKSSPHRWKSFVSNRVSHIQDKILPNLWNHVSSSNNPADCASRGLLPNELINHPLWWKGAPFLHLPQGLWPSHIRTPVDSSEALEEERKITLINRVPSTFLDSLLDRFSSISKIKRILAYALRFIHNLRHLDEKLLGALSSQECRQAILVLVRHVQQYVFTDVIDKLRAGDKIPKFLKKLSVFLADDGILRVGGRLTHSGLSYDRKFPALLPQKHRLVNLLIEDVHRRHLHPGLQTVHFLLAQQFWILSPRRAIRHCLSKCIRCFKVKPIPLQPPMGNLPAVRVNQIKPFQVVGVDFAGPFNITLGKLRGVKSQHAYLCLFVCFSTKATHLELASDLTSDCFLAALRRFIARRGRCSRIYSDRGTNFIGAQRELCRLLKDAAESEMIQWSFNPPSAPHFGGLWEAGVKSVKSHLLRVVGDQVLTYEEFYTVLVQIEAVLNSRPMYPLSSDPNDLSVLTPGHFLTLEPLTSIPDEDLSHLQLNSLSRWQLIQRLQRDIWKRWHAEYLNTLQQKSKWLNSSVEIQCGTLVLIKNNQTPPLKWQLGRIERLHPGTDKISRVATVRTSNGLIRRPLVKLCPVPLPDNS